MKNTVKIAVVAALAAVSLTAAAKLSEGKAYSDYEIGRASCRERV